MIIPTGFAQVNFRFTGPGAPTGAEVTCGLNRSGYAGTPSDAATDLYTVWNNSWRQIQTNQVVLSEVLVKFGPNATGPSGTASGSSAGVLTVQGTSPAVSLLVQKTTLSGGRAGRGRCFMPGCSEPDTSSGGAVDSAYLSAAQGYWDDFHDQLVALDLLPALLHGADSPILTPTQIEAFVVQAVVATQRRRQRR